MAIPRLGKTGLLLSRWAGGIGLTILAFAILFGVLMLLAVPVQWAINNKDGILGFAIAAAVLVWHFLSSIGWIGFALLLVASAVNHAANQIGQMRVAITQSHGLAGDQVAGELHRLNERLEGIEGRLAGSRRDELARFLS